MNDVFLEFVGDNKDGVNRSQEKVEKEPELFLLIDLNQETICVGEDTQMLRDFPAGPRVSLRLIPIRRGSEPVFPIVDHTL